MFSLGFASGKEGVLILHQLVRSESDLCIIIEVTLAGNIGSGNIGSEVGFMQSGIYVCRLHSDANGFNTEM